VVQPGLLTLRSRGVVPSPAAPFNP
jgi:hypothetical protein